MSGPSTPPPNDSLAAGLAALERQDYAVAIAQLEVAAQNAPTPLTRFKAQAALIRAYERSGNIQQAIFSTQLLLRSADPSVQQWASETLDELNVRYAQILCGDTSAASAPSQTVPPAGAVPAGGRADGEQLDDTPFREGNVGDGRNGSQPASPAANSQSERNSKRRSNLGGATEPSAPSAAPEPVPSRSPADPTGFVPLTSPPSRQPPAPSSPAGDPTPALTTDANPFVFPDESAIDAAPIAKTAGEGPGAGRAVDAIAPETTPRAKKGKPSPPGSVRPTSPHSSRRSPRPSRPHPASPAKIIPPRPISWRQADRAQRWAPLSAVRKTEFWLSQVWTAIALLVLSSVFLQTAMAWGNPVRRFFSRFMRVYRWTFLETHLTWAVFLGLVALLCVSPWVLDFILGRFYERRPLTLNDLAARSPEASRLLKRACQQQGCLPPRLGLIPDSTPLLLGYGVLPRTVRLVASQGLLQQLNDDEIAALYAAQWASAQSWGMAPLTLVTLVAQIPYRVYWQIAAWGDRLRQPIWQSLAGLLAACAYGVYWLFRGTGLWLARTVTWQSDRAAVGQTGNPNGLIRALLKVAVGMAADLQRQGQTAPLLESFDLLMPLSRQTALSLGSVYPHALAREESVDVEADPWEQSPALPTGILNWGRLNTHRRWLSINQPHPPLGDRLYALTQITQQWRLDSELTWQAPPSPAHPPSSIWLQAAPFVAVPVGLACAGALWLVGGIAGWVDFRPLTWLWGDRSILWGCLAIGASFGILIRLNTFFIDIKPTNLQVNPDLPDLLADAMSLPVDGQPVQLEGKLLGRQGVNSWLNQDLFLDSAAGLVKLHLVSPLGPLGGVFMKSSRPHALLRRPVVVTGWFRLGTTPWLDVNTIRTRGGRVLRGHHSTWSSLLAIALAVWGAVVIYRGSF